MGVHTKHVHHGTCTTVQEPMVVIQQLWPFHSDSWRWRFWTQNTLAWLALF